MKIKLNYNQDWSKYFQLDENSPSGLLRLKNKNGVDIEPYSVGTKLFLKNSKASTWSLSFKSKDYVVHRIIWVLTYRSIDPELVIDHLDGNPFNNKIENLSLKTTAGNSRNKRKQVDNKTGITGISLTNKKGNYYYQAFWCELDGKPMSKCFSIKKLGEVEAKFKAIECREQQLQRLIAKGADYTERHGL